MRLNVKLIGCGGIGGCLLNVLPKYLCYLPQYKEVHLTLVDGDSYEDKNRTRQFFNKQGNKAEVSAEKIQSEYPNIFCWSNKEYISEDTVEFIVKEGDVVLCCVDNYATRKLVSDYCEQLKNVVMISGGNDLTDGNIQVHVRENGNDLTLPISNSYHPEIQSPQDKNPADQQRQSGCEENAQSQPQLLPTNNFVSALMFNAFDSWIAGVFSTKNKYDEVYADIRVNRAIQCKRSK